jgi:hypothetical protein
MFFSSDYRDFSELLGRQGRCGVEVLSTVNNQVTDGSEALFNADEGIQALNDIVPAFPGVNKVVQVHLNGGEVHI